MFLGNLMLMGAVILAGNNYQRVALLAKFINLGIPDRTIFEKIQGHFVAPVDERHRANIQASSVVETRATEVLWCCFKSCALCYSNHLLFNACCLLVPLTNQNTLNHGIKGRV